MLPTTMTKKQGEALLTLIEYIVDGDEIDRFAERVLDDCEDAEDVYQAILTVAELFGMDMSPFPSLKQLKQQAAAEARETAALGRRDRS